jgi:Raf kinase inhibitor-like YbhB/YbcL family protein
VIVHGIHDRERMSAMGRSASPFALLVLALAVAACGSAPAASSPGAASPNASPSAMASATPPPGTGATATPGASAAPSPGPETEVPSIVFTLTSPDFAAGALIPRTYTCDGQDVSPALAWSGAPAGSRALVLVVDDPDANGFVHWLVLDIPGAGEGTLARGIPSSATSPRQGTNDFGRQGWGGPCPPSGTHHYDFTLYALAVPLGLPGNPRGAAVRAALAGSTVVGTAVLQGLYRRGG